MFLGTFSKSLAYLSCLLLYRIFSPIFAYVFFSKLSRVSKQNKNCPLHDCLGMLPSLECICLEVWSKLLITEIEGGSVSIKTS